jgi:hypothetical protein
MLPDRILIIYCTSVAAAIALVEAMAGIILPAMSLHS